MNDDDQLLRTSEVARILNAHRRTVVGWALSGKLPSIRTPGGHHRFYKTDVEAILERQQDPRS